MRRYLVRRILSVIPVLLVVSVLSFIIIELPPGDFATSRIMELQIQGTPATLDQVDSLRKQYGLDRPIYERYLRWMGGLLCGDLGTSFMYNRPVSDLIGERLSLTITVSIISILLTWLIAVPVGIYSATHQYSALDYSFTFIGFIGLATPRFLMALILMYVAHSQFGFTITGLFSDEYEAQPWSFWKFVDLLKHIWVPALIIGAAGTAGMIRVLRGCLLDELRKQYVITARARGVSERKLIFKYPVRLAINPLLSTIGWVLPAIISGETIVAIVLNMQTIGPMLLNALKSQDMYLAGSCIMLLSVLTVIGTLISDILLAWSDPRIRYE